MGDCRRFVRGNAHSRGESLMSRRALVLFQAFLILRAGESSVAQYVPSDSMRFTVAEASNFAEASMDKPARQANF